MIHDRTGTDEFSLTHESIAEALGIRRPTVTLVARTLRVAGFIQYQRGVVRVLDRRGLERISCECYQASRTAYESIVRNGRARNTSVDRPFQMVSDFAPQPSHTASELSSFPTLTRFHGFPR